MLVSVLPLVRSALVLTIGWIDQRTPPEECESVKEFFYFQEDGSDIVTVCCPIGVDRSVVQAVTSDRYGTQCTLGSDQEVTPEPCDLDHQRFHWKLHIDD